MLLHPDAPFLVLIALGFDAILGDPDWLWRRLPHPVAWIGAGIAVLDRGFNRERAGRRWRKAAGVFAVILIVGGAVVAGLALHHFLRPLPYGLWIEGLAGSVFIAQQSLYRHVAAVRNALGHQADASNPELASARRAVAMIVGRDPDALDEAGISRAAIESLAENFSDGIVAPAFYLALFGLPGLLAYKAINTADSMIGHLSPRHRDFGWAAARLDDLANLLPARLAGLLLCLVAPLAGGDILLSLKIMWRDAGLHRSPNAGWPECAMAAGLGRALGGPRRYGDLAVDEPFLNRHASPLADGADITRALRLMVAACVVQCLAIGALALA